MFNKLIDLYEEAIREKIIARQSHLPNMYHYWKGKEDAYFNAMNELNPDSLSAYLQKLPLTTLISTQI